MSRVNHILVKSGLQAKKIDVPLPSDDPETYTIYGEDWCGYTSLARQMCQTANKKFRYISFRDNRPLRNEFSYRYAFGHSTIPLIFKGKKFIGGFEQLKNDF